ncbi:MAG TPA: VOC family protein [Chloroflexota bacterium]|nr:VOC family protein [Chloroflexota bacterium]
MKIEAYLFFPGNAEEAMTFYQGIFGGDLSTTRRGDVDPSAPDSEKQLLINAALDTGEFILRASDRSDATKEPQTRIELTVVGSDEAGLRKIFDELSNGGTVKVPLEKMFWGDIFGALIDKFGIGWQVDITAG